MEQRLKQGLRTTLPQKIASETKMKSANNELKVPPIAMSSSSSGCREQSQGGHEEADSRVNATSEGQDLEIQQQVPAAASVTETQPSNGDSHSSEDNAARRKELIIGILDGQQHHQEGMIVPVAAQEISELEAPEAPPLIRSHRERYPVQPGAVRVPGVAGAADEEVEHSDSSSQELPLTTIRAPTMSGYSTGENSQLSVITVAYTVEEDGDLENRIRNQLIQESVCAGSVTPIAVPAVKQKERVKRYALVVVIIVIATLMAVTITAMTRRGGDSSSAGYDENQQEYAEKAGALNESRNRPMLDIVRERGFIRCGLFMATGFCAEDPETGRLKGINVDQVRKRL